ncbi:hypothetical protein NCC78_15335 [Micromonospora phytophila]|uniref:hypothetical protein n=1 Tax=Micromonospora phytophila TaxID=709888 RepID=UPI00202F94A9|nr:hypothetical protein [Micromonospora phytophila]MCM0676053.1 hypothetical protein [Micromonospora phytophila]
MSSFPGSPRTLRGAIIAVDPLGPLSRVVVFQYNPDQVQRNLQPRSGGDSGQRSADVHRAWGAPTETVSMTVEIDATDQLEVGDPVAGSVGVLPQLSVLEMLLHPGSVRVIANTALLAAGMIEILPVELPMAVMVWGPGRVVPVKITQLGIAEQAFNPALSPIRASVDISAQVLTYDDLPLTDVGYGLYLAHLVAKELLAVVGSVTGAVSAVTELTGA